jgi:tetratricopeptide (TPR) repeat protein
MASAVADPESLVPRSAGPFDQERLRTLPLAAIDRFVLSLIDGVAPIRQLASTIGIGVEEVMASVLKLESMQLVVLPSASGERPAVSSGMPPSGAGARTATDGSIDIDPEHQRQITDLYERLDTLDHYRLLGIGRTADKKEIKRAYFEATSRFHPDRFFRKNLGEFKGRMEAIFGRMTAAHDTLTAPDRRAEYDAYIESVQQSRSIEDLLSDALAEVKRAEDAVRAVPVSSIPPAHGSPPSSAPRAMPSTIPPASSASAPFEARTTPGGTPVVSPSTRPSAPPGPRINIGPAADRRELLARRLTGALRPAPTPKISVTPMPSAQPKTDDAVSALKRRYEDRVTLARESQARKYIDTGKAAKAKGDMVAAANAFRVALQFDADNAELKASHEEAQRAADLLLAEQYLKQAEYEEKSERWAEAARSWRRVARARENDARAHERGAHCILKAEGDLHDASALAQRAVQLESKNAGYRVTLANVYLAAGLAKNAKRELEAAAQLAPADAGIASLLKRIGKG